MFGWISIPSHYVWWIAAVSVVSFVGTLAAIPLIVTRMRADYFVNPEPPSASFAGRHPAIRILLHGAKIGLGVILVLLGIVLSLPGVPGQGLLTILMGLMLLEFPGKRRMELWLVRRGAVRTGINWMRARAGREPLQFAEPEAPKTKQPGG